MCVNNLMQVFSVPKLTFFLHSVVCVQKPSDCFVVVVVVRVEKNERKWNWGK